MTICGNSSVVEHNLAKVGVASSNLVSRSKFYSVPFRVELASTLKQILCPDSSRGLGHRPFTAVTGVRIPYGTPLLEL